MQETIEYFDDKQKLIGEFIYDESATSKQATIIVFPAFEGKGEFAIDYANRLHQHGFNVFVADIYGDGKVVDTIEGCFELVMPFLENRSLVRTRANLTFNKVAELNQVDADNIGAIGFCFGGMCLLEVVRSGLSLKAGVSAHGILEKSDLPTKKITSELLILHGYQDPQVQPDNLSSFADEMHRAGKDDWVFTFFGNAKHSFTDPKTGTFDPGKESEMGREYNKIAAQRSFRYALDFFNEILS